MDFLANCDCAQVVVRVIGWKQQALSASVSTAYNADVDADVADVFVLIYKTSAVIGFNQVVATAVRAVLYIPEAVFA